MKGSKAGEGSSVPARTYSQAELQRVIDVRAVGVQLQHLALSLASLGDPDLSGKVLAVAYRASKVRARPEAQA